MLQLAAVVASLALLSFVWYRDRVQTARRRARMFHLCLPLFVEAEVTERRGDFPMLAGLFHSQRFTLEAFPDTLGYRKIPSLWMQVTLTATLPINGTVDILARPQNIEFFSPSNELHVALPAPTSWPQPILFRANTENHGLDIRRIETNVAKLFTDNRIKELLITERGLRVIYQLAQAEKSRYFVFRMAEFEEMTVNPDFLRELMYDILALRANIVPKS